jgi:hypothetical protein
VLVILRWGLVIGVLVGLIDVVTSELTRGAAETDLVLALETIDLILNLGLCGLAGYRVASALGEMRPGLEAAVLAGLIVGAIGIGYHLARGTEDFGAAQMVEMVAWNIVLAASAGSLGAWGRTARREAPPGPPDGRR